MKSTQEPVIIQGGMGAAVSSWQLARAVALTGQLGVVSGTALDLILARRLQLGDPGGHLRRAMAEFPVPHVANRVLKQYFIPGGKAPDQPFRLSPVPSSRPSRELVELVVLANFVEVWLAGEGGAGPVGINYLEKIQAPTLPSLFGAMLAGVDYVLMGAGIPRVIPGILDRLAEGQEVEMPLDVEGAGRDERFVAQFSPAEFAGGSAPWLKRPRFLAIVSSSTLATMLTRKANGHVDGFVVEGPTAGGHNAPPRGAVQLNARGEPIYGARDVPDLEAFRSLERPFWLAGSYGSPERLVEALDAGATGVQVGTAFAYCNESGLRPDIKRHVLKMCHQGTLEVLTDPVASPTGFPFKVLSLPGSLSDETVYEERDRICDLGFLRRAYRRPDGTLGWRCQGEKVDAFVQKGGCEQDTVGRKCVCNGLMSTIGLGQVRGPGKCEPSLVTSGDDVRSVARFLPTTDAEGYSAHDVIQHLLSGIRPPASLTVDARG
jgi:nitronate monooxygenase